MKHVKSDDAQTAQPLEGAAGDDAVAVGPAPLC